MNNNLASTPIPKPRTQRLDTTGKKPIPLPRTQKATVKQIDDEIDSASMSSSPSSIKSGSSFFNTLRDELNIKRNRVLEIGEEISERVQEHKKTMLETSKQFTEDLQEKKRAVIESARHAHHQVKSRVARRFSSLNRDGSSVDTSEKQPHSNSLPPESLEIFDGIKFQSPFTLNKKTNDTDDEFTEEEDRYTEPPSFPPPKLPPPPLPNESVYDEPHSTGSSSCGGTLSSVSLSERLHYEEIFPDGNSLLNFAQNNAHSSDSDNSEHQVNSSQLRRSESWSFYDSVHRATNENVYNGIPEVDDGIYANDNVSAEPPPRPERKDRKNNKILNIPSEELAKMNILRLSEISSISVQNTLYENHILQPQQINKVEKSTEVLSSPRITDSMIIEFDPLNNIQSNDTSSNLSDLSVLESILQGDTYGALALSAHDEWNGSQSDEESEMGDTVPVPVPPTRFDSLPENEQSTTWYTNVETSTQQNVTATTPATEKTNWMRQRLSGVFQKLDTKNLTTRLSFRGRDDIQKAQSSSNRIVIDRPSALTQSIITHQGLVMKISRSGGVEDLFSDINPRWCYLGNGKLICYSDSTLKVIKETIPVETILSVQLILQNRIINISNKNGSPGINSDTTEEYHCFEITTSVKGPRNKVILGTRNMSDRRLWMQKLIESQTTVFPSMLISDFIRAGWVCLREGASGVWKGTWLLLHNRQLVFIQDGCDRKTVDLRTARCIILQEAEPDAPKTSDNGPQMLVDCAVGGTLYIHTGLRRNTCAWRLAIRQAAHNNGASLDQQQITSDNVPVIVDKCINFVYAHGSMSEGIYRRSGTGKLITEILTEFNHDAWAVQLTKDRCTEHDIACVLKRFMRNLPEAALTNKLYPYFCKVTEIQSKEEKITMYKKLLEQLPPIAFQTIKKLMSHLHFIQTQAAQNQMTISNLATIWGPTLMHAESNENSQWSKNEINVIADLIKYKNALWPSTPDELNKEKTMLAVLLRYYQSSLTSAASRISSGDLKVWIYLHAPNSSECFHVTLTPQKTALDICTELSAKIMLPTHKLQLEESVLNGQLTRPIHYSESVLNAVLQWSYWDNADCKDNCLVLRPNELFTEITSESQRPIATSGELKYADDKSKTFKNYMFEFSQAKLSYYKDKNCSTKLGEWKIEEIIWYIGYEIKRNPHTRWCITFFPKSKTPKRTKLTPWFGHAIAGTERVQELRWLYAMTYGEHPLGLIPPPIHVDLLET